MYAICENPSFIVHPNVISFAERAKYYCVAGELFQLQNNDKDLIYSDFSRWFFSHFPKVSVFIKDINKYFSDNSKKLKDYYNNNRGKFKEYCNDLKDTKDTEFDDKRHFFRIDYVSRFSSFDEFLNHLTKVNDIKEYSFVDENGEVFPVYLEVRCNKCDACRAQRLNSLVQQAEFEMLVARPECEHFFVTLTYNEEHLPRMEGSSLGVLVKEHVQKYIKRIRSFIAKVIGPEDSRLIKVMYSGEYGKKGTFRPHYHVVFFNFPYYKFHDLPQWHVFRIFEYFWTIPHYYNEEDVISFFDYKCNQYAVLSDSAQKFKNRYSYGICCVKKLNNNNIAKYVAKYIAKGSKTILGRPSTFFNRSIHFGMTFFEKHVIPQLEYNKKNTFTYRNLDFKIKDDSHCCSYYLSKYLPNVSKLVPCEIRRSISAIRWFYYELQRWSKKRFLVEMEYISMLVEKIPYPIELPCRIDSDSDRDYKYKKLFSFRQVRNAIIENIEKVQDFFASNSYESLQDYQRKRTEFYKNSLSEISVNDAIFKLKQQILKLENAVKL